MKKTLFILPILAFSALSLRAQNLVQSTAPVLQAQPLEVAQAPAANGSELKSSTAPSLGAAATPAPALPASGTETKQNCQASLPGQSGDSRKDD